MNVRLRHLALTSGLVCGLLLPRVASAGTISVQNLQDCTVLGLDSTTSTVRNGAHCDAGNTPFSLSDVLNGTIGLLVGDNKTPSWNLINDTGAALDSLTLYFSGVLGTNAFIDMDVSHTSIFVACTVTTATDAITTSPDCGAEDRTAQNPDLALQLVWSGGTGLAVGEMFNLATSAFAHGGADAGCFSGAGDCQADGSTLTSASVPEPTTLVLLGLGLGMTAMTARRRAARR